MMNEIPMQSLNGRRRKASSSNDDDEDDENGGGFDVEPDVETNGGSKDSDRHYLVPRNPTGSIEENEAALATSRPVNMTTIKMLQLNAFWFGYQTYWFLISIVIVPKQVEDIMGKDAKGRGLSIVTLLAGIINLFIAVIFGSLNDRFASKYGKRRLWIIGGSIAMCISLYLLSSHESLIFYTFGYICVTCSAVICSVPFNGLLADVTNEEQKGPVSGIMGFMNLGGNLFGALIGTFLSGDDRLGMSGLYMVIIAILIVSTLITVYAISEKSSSHLKNLPPIDWKPFLWEMIEPVLKHRDFRLVLISRFLFQLGIATVTQFLQYWIGDCVKTDIPVTQAVSLALVPLLVLSPIGAICIPKKKRKIVIYVATIFMITSCSLLEFVTDFGSSLVASGIFGMGYGPFISTEFAMLMDILPSQEEAAKDIAVWHSALVLPQIVATPVAGWLLDLFQDIGKRDGMACLGYNIVFSICIVYFLAGAEVTRRIRGVE